MIATPVLDEPASPDVVLLDMMMPVLDGIETCRLLKANPVTRGIPVVMVTAMGAPAIVEAAFKAGCDDYLAKPVREQELLSVLSVVLTTYGEKDQRRRAAPPSKTSELAVATVSRATRTRR